MRRLVAALSISSMFLAPVMAGRVVATAAPTGSSWEGERLLTDDVDS